MYVVLSAIEEDLRQIITLYLSPTMSTGDILGAVLLGKLKTRLEADQDVLETDNTLDRLLTYADFADSYEILAKHKAQSARACSKAFFHRSPEAECTNSDPKPCHAHSAVSLRRSGSGHQHRR